jgi:hypothetical protein
MSPTTRASRQNSAWQKRFNVSPAGIRPVHRPRLLAPATKLARYTSLRSTPHLFYSAEVLLVWLVRAAGNNYDVAESDRGLVIARRTRSQPTMRSASPCYNLVWWPNVLVFRPEEVLLCHLSY